MAIFGPKRWVNRLRKMFIFRLFELLIFIVWKSVFSFKNMVTDTFLPSIAWKKQVAKIAIFEPKPLVNPFGEMSSFLDFLNFLFL